MPPDPKSLARDLARASLAALAPRERERASAALCQRVARLPEWRQARVRMAFVPDTRDATPEPDVWPLVVDTLRDGARVALPRTDWSDRSMVAVELASVKSLSQDLADSKGVREGAPHLSTIALSEVEVLLVPGVAFDLRCGRLGRGAGFYDRFLARHRAAMRSGPYAPPRDLGVLVGVCFDEQILDEAPMGAQDVRMDVVITPTRTLWAPTRWLPVRDG
jgi:5-formyltetrahydrofolate cyclo-ligase